MLGNLAMNTSFVGNLLSGIDLRLTFVSAFLGFMTIWHVMSGTIFPDAIYFAIITLISLAFAVIGIDSESGIEM